MHPLHQFKYCPKCGSDGFAVNNEKSKRCSSCGFVYYFNPSAAVACFIRNEVGELLVVRRAKDPAKGTLDLPGGFVDLHESAEEAVRREVKEETGLDVKSSRYLFSIPNIYLYSGFEVHTEDLFFECYATTFDGLIAADDASEIVVLKLQEVDASLFGLTSVKEGVVRYCKEN
ncbi:NUDIX hydrolase [Macellibacteroides fermentans]|jgi:8-oxo-dGTP pyrophosphatase MutT (NUDIX family)|uniref:NUDIX domain-containing protein n=2 Tax=Bacteroidales TaxID=171549 RepID=A0A1T5B0N8_9BACT|nr:MULTISPECIES: NUDIX domain-containing protein [Bacteroidales]MBP7939071.1 NUDIX domain-containing protein [Parabacteroides sp.]MDT3367726.1 NUDIX domain-containing protein [Bacteroidota bacterium]MBP8012022.1 NUDIX domain-containing protein [Parabacteroides sp.]NYI49944.1 8-oxo-dGTP pyrophosphatase MutT (NUDIX family) [Macellibacteroides fermentans]SKB40423.1 NUDIX domain-containing protein [Parabacteroides chartae]